MRMRSSWLLAACLLLPSASSAGDGQLRYRTGSLVTVGVEVEGRPTSLYPAPDGSGRYYLEAREGARYAVRIANRSQARLGVRLSVDGLDAISGERVPDLRVPGRMYVIGPGQSVVVQGWRTSLSEVRRFTFVDEGVSYAARSGQANGKMGWLEVAVFREATWARAWDLEQDAAGRAVPRVQSPTAPAADARAESASKAGRAYAGTGWGDRQRDRAVLVAFDPEPTPAECLTFRYEYRDALVALGILPQPLDRGRLWQREHAVDGFARPPLW